MKKLAFAVVLAAGVVAGCMKGVLSEVPESASRMLRVGSYNIRNGFGDKGTPNAWECRKGDLAALLRRLDLDVFGLQEVYAEQADYLKDSLPQYEMVGVHRDDGVRKGEASPVFYRKDRLAALKSGTFWLSDTPDVPGSKSWGTAYTRICTWALLKDCRTGRAFCFANTHTDHKSALARKEGMLLIIRRMREFAPAGTPIVFTGDHNCCETDEPAKAVSAILNDSLYVSEKPPVGPWRTYNGWKWLDKEYTAAEAMKLVPDVRNEKKGGCGFRIDYIYVSDGIRVMSHETHADVRPGTKLYPSDHFPVSAVIIL